jgi:hypothetical protein
MRPTARQIVKPLTAPQIAAIPSGLERDMAAQISLFLGSKRLVNEQTMGKYLVLPCRIAKYLNLKTRRHQIQSSYERHQQNSVVHGN